MTIRYSCETCGSTLKIKDDLAGKPGKCPKCKTPFTVPSPDAEPPLSDDAVPVSAQDAEDDQPSALSSTPLRDDFDVDAFLMSDSAAETGKKAKRKPVRTAPLDDDEASLADDPDDAPKRPKGKSAATADEDDDEAFQIRRPEASEPSSKKFSMPPGLDEEAEAPAKPARRPPGTTPGGNAANIAQDLLSKSGKKGKKAAWTDQDPNADKEPGYDYAELGRLAATRVAPIVIGGVVAVWLMYRMVFSAMGNKTYLPELGRVTGTVTFNGKPLAGTELIFQPIRPVGEQTDKTKRASASSAVTNSDGWYEVNYLADVKGVAVGECRVEVQAMGRNDIPIKYVGARSELKFEIKPGKQVIDIELKK